MTSEEFVYKAFNLTLGTDKSAGGNFFDLGGDSLAAMEIAARVEEKYGVEFPIEELLTSGDIDSVARAVVRRLQNP